jgi:hypothetical protein
LFKMILKQGQSTKKHKQHKKEFEIFSFSFFHSEALPSMTIIREEAKNVCDELNGKNIYIFKRKIELIFKSLNKMRWICQY